MDLPAEKKVYTSTEYAALMAFLMGSIEKVDKDMRNSYKGYDYASADAVFAAVRVAMADLKLHLVTQELSFKIHDFGTDDKPSRHIELKVYIGITDGSVVPLELITVMGPYTAPQSIQALRTYAVKYWLRTKLLLPTGESDLDEAKNLEIAGPVLEFVDGEVSPTTAAETIDSALESME